MASCWRKGILIILMILVGIISAGMIQEQKRHQNHVMIKETIGFFIDSLENGCVETLKQISAGGFRCSLTLLHTDRAIGFSTQVSDYSFRVDDEQPNGVFPVLLEISTETPSQQNQNESLRIYYELRMVNSSGKMRICYFRIVAAERM